MQSAAARAFWRHCCGGGRAYAFSCQSTEQHLQWGRNPAAATLHNRHTASASMVTSAAAAAATTDGGGGGTATREAMEAAMAAARGRPPVVCYHWPCIDGVFAALAAHAYFAARGVAPQWRPMSTFAPPSLADLKLSGGEAVFFLDYTGPPGLARAAADVDGCVVVVLDHHKTAAEHLGVAAGQQQRRRGGNGGGDGSPPPPPLPANLHALLDMHRSGAMLALDFFGRDGFSADTLRAFELVQDADLWTWRLPEARAFNAGMGAVDAPFDAAAHPGLFGRLMGLKVADVVAKGEAVLADQARRVDAAVASARRVTLGGPAGARGGWGVALCADCGPKSDLVKWRSALGNALAAAGARAGLAPVGVVAYREAGMPPDRVKVSLRSVQGYDTTRVAEAFGGGGHAAASSCIVSEAEFDRWRVQ